MVRIWSLTHWYITIPAATPTLIERVLPNIPHILTFRLDSSGGLASDGCAEIVIQVEKQGRNVDLSDRIIIQDRLLGETRNEYVYQSTDGPDGEIVRVCCGDIATLDRIYAKKGINVFENEASYVFANESERPISIAELEVIKDLTAMSEVVDSPAVRTKHKEYPYPDTFMPM